MKKRRTFGKTAREWNRLYKKYKDRVRYKRNLYKLTRSEFIEAYVNRGKGETIRDIAKKTIKETAYQKYVNEYTRFLKKGYGMSSMLSERAFNEQIIDYGSYDAVVKSQFFTSLKQAEAYAKHAEILGIKAKKSDFLKENEKADLFWAEVASLGGWASAFEY